MSEPVSTEDGSSTHQSQEDAEVPGDKISKIFEFSNSGFSWLAHKKSIDKKNFMSFFSSYSY